MKPENLHERLIGMFCFRRITSLPQKRSSPKLTTANALGMSVNLGFREFTDAFSAMPRSQCVKSHCYC